MLSFPQSILLPHFLLRTSPTYSILHTMWPSVSIYTSLATEMSINYSLGLFRPGWFLAHGFFLPQLLLPTKEIEQHRAFERLSTENCAFSSTESSTPKTPAHPHATFWPDLLFVRFSHSNHRTRNLTWHSRQPHLCIRIRNPFQTISCDFTTSSDNFRVRAWVLAFSSFRVLYSARFPSTPPAISTKTVFTL